MKAHYPARFMARQKNYAWISIFNLAVYGLFRFESSLALGLPFMNEVPAGGKKKSVDGAHLVPRTNPPSSVLTIIEVKPPPCHPSIAALAGCLKIRRVHRVPCPP